MRLLLCTALLAAAVSAAGHIAHGYRPLVATREGRVKGVMDRSAGGHLFYCFKGIPYAQPPLRHLRFQAPQRHAGWRGIRDGIDHGNRCLQFDHLNNFTRVGDEDCLFVNVYSRQLPGQESSLTGLPVLVLIHGGGFFFGSGDADEYGPHYFMDEPVVLVTFNYRLGAFGFFSTHDNAAPGNYGLLDQVVLLHWVQDNIANFGGDPKSVTIFGQAAGGSSVSLQVLSPLTKDLFHHAISQSGMSFSTFAARDSRKGSEKKLSKQLGCTKPDGRISVNCISTDNLPRERPGSPGYAMTRFMVNLWTNFARTGQPRSDILLLPDWPIYTEQYQRHMRLNSQPALGERLFEERVNFWQTVAINEQWRHLPVKTANGC
ncbi:Esterase FE4 [Amphibalanus amphitrite]|uniref:Esterase FE4 n=1 Tax=Amphibalanus amphitrite TaxID=1232801 RepID=A0A6A4VCD5_AMPAM|nr:Esterase FE4 [Amphibalanus amphitrite]